MEVQTGYAIRQIQYEMDNHLPRTQKAGGRIMSEETGKRAERPDSERRIIVADDLALRGEGDGPRHIIGHAAVFDQWATLHESPSFTMREIVRPGAFAQVIHDREDVRALFNHNASFILGRTASGTLRLTEDARGLAIDIEPPDTALIRELVLAPIKRHDITQMSFSFKPRRSAPEGGERITVRREADRIIESRELLSVNIYDVSPATYPAYEGTDVALRGWGAAREIEARERIRAAERKAKSIQLTRMCCALRLAGARFED